MMYAIVNKKKTYLHIKIKIMFKEIDIILQK